MGKRGLYLKHPTCRSLENTSFQKGISRRLNVQSDTAVLATNLTKGSFRDYTPGNSEGEALLFKALTSKVC